MEDDRGSDSNFESDEVYPPSEDTHLLLEACLDEIDGGKLLEVGTGSGFVSHKIDEKTSAEVVATDINPHAVREASHRGVEAVRTNLVDAVCWEFDYVVFNPPYLPERDDEDESRSWSWIDEALTSGKTGRSVTVEFLETVGRVLADDGTVLLLVSSKTGIREVTQRASDEGFGVAQAARSSLFFEELVVLRLTKNN
ncbi:MAG: HemK2/MTQ2 family protein methyltransferase [Halobacteria archaeon]|nr:HemK2/MTQ2 family protein methyltransferase [Halobacteria archaeon]